MMLLMFEMHFYDFYVLESIRKYDKHRNSEVKDIDSCVMKWFHNSKDRNGGREKRRINADAKKSSTQDN